MVEKHKKHVIVSGLDGTYERKPFIEVLKLIPIADEVIRLNALCIRCCNGTLASFSKRIVQDTNIELVGGTESYIPVCRSCFNA
jgi:thymidine kinase